MYKRQLFHLKKAGFKSHELVKVYECMLRPIAEYCSCVFYSMITKRDSDELERIQRQALKIIFGYNNSYSQLLEKSGLIRLSEGRENAFLKMSIKLSGDYRFKNWFPKRVYRHHEPRPGADVYKLYGASTNRYMNSPLKCDET